MFSSRRFFSSLTRTQKTLAIHQALYLSFQTPKASRAWHVELRQLREGNTVLSAKKKKKIVPIREKLLVICY